MCDCAVHLGNSGDGVGLRRFIWYERTVGHCFFGASRMLLRVLFGVMYVGWGLFVILLWFLRRTSWSVGSVMD